MVLFHHILSFVRYGSCFVFCLDDEVCVFFTNCRSRMISLGSVDSSLFVSRSSVLDYRHGERSGCLPLRNM
jgi:hypothetical protein